MKTQIEIRRKNITKQRRLHRLNSKFENNNTDISNFLKMK